MTRQRKINLTVIIASGALIVSIIVGIIMPSCQKLSASTERSAVEKERIRANDSLRRAEQSAIRESLSSANQRIDRNTNDIRLIHSDIKDIKNMLEGMTECQKETMKAIEKMGGKIDYQNLILKTRDGEVGDLHSREH
jgi:5-bromo-4-chloroindolyl phosphate hydrolysis protein